MGKATYIVTVDDAHKQNIQDVSQRLKAAGMDVQSELHSLGAITGAFEPEQESRISKVEGVLHVRQSGELRA